MVAEHDHSPCRQTERCDEREACAEGIGGPLHRRSSQNREPDSLALGVKARNFVTERVGVLQESSETAQLTVLARRGPLHGYGITAHIQRLSEHLRVEEGSLYPALHRMEKARWIKARQITTEHGRRARAYEITTEGRRQLGIEEERWVRTIIRDAALMTGIGIVVGLTGGVYLSRFVRTLLYETYPTDVSSIALPIGCLLLVAFLAAVPAARRTVRLDPVTALRLE